MILNKIIPRQVSYSITMLFLSTLAFSKSPNQVEHNYGEIIRINSNEQIQFEDGLSITLAYFSHKRPKIGGPTKATAYLKLSQNNSIEEISLSIHGIEGNPDQKEYDSLTWGKYEFQLKNFVYNNFIEVIVLKR